LADAYLVLCVFDSSPARAFAKKAKVAALKALEIDSEHAEALTALGVNLLGDWLRDTLDPKLRV